MATIKSTPSNTPLKSAIDAVLVLSIAEAANKVNSQERADGVQVKVDLPQAVAINDVITFVLTNPQGTVVTITRVVTAADIAAAVANVTIPAGNCVLNGAYSLEASLRDAAGNTSPKVVTGFEIDRVAPPKPSQPTAYTDDVGDVQSLNSTANLTDDARPAILVGTHLEDVPSLYVDGKRVAATYDPTKGTLTPDVAVTDGTHAFSVTLTDGSGNESFRSNALVLTIDTTPTSNAAVALAVNLGTDANNDGWVNASEAGSASTLTSRATFNANAVAGDKIVFTATNNGVALASQTVTLTAADIANKYVNVSFAKPAEGVVQAVSASYVDAAGNAATDARASDSARLDTVVNAPVIGTVQTIWYNDGTSMGYHNALDIANGGSMQVGWPQVYGRAEPGSAVDVYMSTGAGAFAKLGTVTANASGDFHYNYYTYNGGMLGDNTYVFKVAYKDVAGNQSTFSNTWTVTVDSVAPVKPVVLASDDVGALQGAIASNGFTDDTRPTFTGRGEAGNLVRVYDGSTQLGSVTVAADGSWSYTPATALAEGQHSITATETDKALNISQASNPLSFTVDTTAPTNSSVALGVILGSDANNDGWVNASEAGSASTLTSRATFNANAVAGDKIVFTATNNGVALASQTVTLTAADIANKYVNVSFAKPAEGVVQAVSASYVDAAGNAATDARASDSARLDTVVNAPVIGTVQTIWYNDGTSMGYHNALDIANGGSMQVGWPQVYGRAEPGSAVDVYMSTGAGAFAKLGTVTANASGDFHYNYYTYNGGMLGDNTYVFKVAYKDVAGNQSTFSNTWTVTVDSVAPVKPVVLASDDVGALQGAIASNGFTDDTRPTFTGRGEAGNLVRVYDGSTQLGSVTVAADGSWSYTPATALAEGQHSITATETDKALNISQASNPLSFTVDTTAPTNSSVALGVILGSDANNDGWVNASEAGSASTLTSRATFNANAVAGDKIVFTATNNGVALASQTVTLTAADIANKYVNVSFAKPAEGVVQAVSASYVDAAGNAATDARASDSARLDTVANAPVINTVQTVWYNDGTGTGYHNALDIANGGSMQVGWPQVYGRAEPGSAVDVYMSTGAGAFAKLGTIAADANGDFHYNYYTYNGGMLGDNTYAFKVAYRDVAGNQSTFSNTWTVTVDSVAPVKPVVLASDDVGALQGAIASNGFTDDTRPTFTGRGEAGNLVRVYDGSTQLGSVTVAADGSWSYTPATALAEGQHSITATETDKALNISQASNALSFTVDRVAPTAPTVTMSDAYLVPGQTADVRFTFSEAVTGFDASDISAPYGSISGLASADGGKTWTATFTPNANVNVGNQHISVGAAYTDLAGNAGVAGSSAAYSVLTSYGVSLGQGVSAPETVTLYETRYKTFVSDTQAYSTERWFNNFFLGHDYKLEYKLSNGACGFIDLNDAENYTDSSQQVLFDGTSPVYVTDVRLWNYICAGFWKTVGGSSSTMDLEDDAGVLGWGLFADWHDARIHVETQSYQRAYTTTVQATDYRINFSNSGTFRQETPNACYKISLSGGNNYQLQDLSGNVLMGGAGTYQATIAQIDAGLKVHVSSGGNAPSGISAAYVSTASPLVLDLDGNGVQTVSVEHGTRFDLTGSGAQTVGWLDRKDGLLVMDLNHNGKVDSGAELFGNATLVKGGQKAADGWAALAEQDSNGDGLVDARDAHFADLRVWVDANGDAVTDAGELKTLAEVGIQSLNVGHAEASVVQNGNLLDGAGSFTKVDGAVSAMTDVWFQLAQPQVLDLAQVNTAVVNGVKTLNLADGAAQQITLNLSDVLATPKDAHGLHMVRVSGDADDVVHLGQGLAGGAQGTGHWNAQGSAVVNDQMYTVYQYSADSSLQVLIDQHVAAANVHCA